MEANVELVMKPIMFVDASVVEPMIEPVGEPG